MIAHHRQGRLRGMVTAGVLGGLLAGPARAQGSLSTLGFGYPVGGMSTRVSGTAGAFGEIDALTLVNPASLGGVQRTVLSLQAEPEYRTLRLGTVRERTTAQRIPLISVLFPARHGVAVGVSAASFLDRSYSLATTGTVSVDTGQLSTTDLLSVRGAMGKLTGAVGWQVNTRLKVGVAGHLFTGGHLVARERTFSDTTSFGRIRDTSQVTYFGTGVTLGADVRLVKGLAATVSYRAGGGLDALVRDTVRASASTPGARGASLRYDGIPGTVFAAGIEQVTWSSLRGLASSRTTVQDARNWRLGAETAGPRLRGVPLFVRLGYARNQLPFSTTMARVEETRWSTGLGVPIARDFGTLDFSLQRATRALPGTTAREASWFLGIGLQVRPIG